MRVAIQIRLKPNLNTFSSGLVLFGIILITIVRTRIRHSSYCYYSFRVYIGGIGRVIVFAHWFANHLLTLNLYVSIYIM